MKISFHLHVNENSFSYERMSTRTRFDEEVKGNSEMAYYDSLFFVIYLQFIVSPKMAFL